MVQAKGERADVPSLPLTGPVGVQLFAAGSGCFEAQYQPRAFRKNEPGSFKAKGGAPMP